MEETSRWERTMVEKEVEESESGTGRGQVSNGSQACTGLVWLAEGGG
jgi:hypothetical protein